MEEKMMILAGILIILGFFLLERHRRYKLEKKIDQLVNELDHFLLSGEKNLEESLEEGKIENLKNRLAAVEDQVTYQIQYRENRENGLNQFIENMSHQMKTSLTALQIRIDLAQAKDSLSDARKELDECQKCMERITREVERILECSQLADRKIPMRLERCEVKQLIKKTTAALEPLWKKKNVDIALELLDIHEIPELYLDSYWFSQALANVVKNAIEHTPEYSTVSITANDCGRSLVLEIKDEGEGIDEDEFPHLFERFRRGNYAKAGYGIGLSMAEDILRAHHGSIQAYNLKEKGSCFRLKVPILSEKRPYEQQKNDLHT